jgi:hypothetical protein
MSIRYKLFLAFGAVLVLAACVAFYGLHAIASAGNLVVQLYDQSFIAPNSARGAQVRFNEGRAAVAPPRRRRPPRPRSMLSPPPPRTLAKSSRSRSAR